MFKNPFASLTKFEWTLWICSLLVVSGSFFFSPEKNILPLIASLIGITALIFIAKGHILGQLLTIVFALFYGWISYYFQYYGEMITYLCMTAPIAVVSAISWWKHPYQNSAEVEVAHMTKIQITTMIVLTIVVTIAFYFILHALHTANLFVSTLSIATSFLASYMTFLRSPFYAIGYACNDVILIVLWFLATLENSAYLPMCICFLMFLFNDVYGYYSWRNMQKRQKDSIVTNTVSS